MERHNVERKLPTIFLGVCKLFWACPSFLGSGYLLQVLASLRAFRVYPSCDGDYHSFAASIKANEYDCRDYRPGISPLLPPAPKNFGYCILMNLQQFIDEYNYPGAVILLEGKRNVLSEDVRWLKNLGYLLAKRMPLATFRSGNAPGSDAYFAEGVSLIDAARMQVIVPYSGHRKQSSDGYQIYSLDDIAIAAEPEVLYHSRQNKSHEKFVDRYAAGNRDRYTIKASYIIRDTVKVVGAEGIAAATFGSFTTTCPIPAPAAPAIR